MVSTHAVGVVLSMTMVATRLGFMLMPRKVKREDLEAEAATDDAETAPPSRKRRRKRTSARRH